MLLSVSPQRGDYLALGGDLSFSPSSPLATAVTTLTMPAHLVVRCSEP